MEDRQYLALIDQIDAIVWEADAETFRFSFVSKQAEKLLGYPISKWMDEPDFWVSTIHPDDRDRALNLCLTATAKDEDHTFEYRSIAADGRVVWLRDIVRVVRDEHTGQRLLRGVMVDISDHREAQARLLHQASHDDLTGLPNRNLLTDRLTQSLSNAARHDHMVGVLFFDLDRFKTINDSLGHDTGDQLLIAVAERLRDSVRGGDTVARVGGDEFVTVLNEVRQPHDAVRVARKILDCFDTPFELEVQQPGGGRQHFYSTTSIGISLYPDDGSDPQTVLKNADAAMYRAKASGGNTYQFFTAEMDEQERRRLDMEHSLRSGLEHEDFVLHFQPQVDTVRKQLIGVEALLRWRQPGKGLVMPDDFIPLLEETGLIVSVGEWVLRKSCEQYMAWRAAGHDIPHIAVNLSPRQLRHDGFLETVQKSLLGADMDARCLELEITESVFTHRIETSLETLRQLNALGVRLLMDDFGTGYSSLSHLKLLPVSGVKADRVFISGVPHDQSDSAIVESVLTLAKALELDVIAEGVETEEQLEFLHARGCDAIQGYLISKPLDAEGMTAFLRMLD